MRLSKILLHSYSKNRFDIPCTFELRTYEAKLTTTIHDIEENGIEVMRDKMTSMRSVWHMAEHKEMIHDTMASSDSTLAWPTCLIFTLAYKAVKLELRNMSSENEECPTVDQV